VIALVGTVLGASLLGSPHCAGMCGGFMCFVAGQDGRRWWPQAAYHGGRLLTYASLGLAAGALGGGIERLGTAAGVARAAAILAGVAMVAWGALALATALGARRPRGASPGAGHARIVSALRRVAGQPPVVRALVVGLLTTLLPCGWLWAFVATAAATGSPAGGAATMAVFWVGTVPALVGVGVLARGAFGPLRRRLPVLTSAAMIAVGLLTVAGKFQVGFSGGAHAGGAACAEHVHGNR
jgi:sulfite exporter TauE/SafE